MSKRRKWRPLDKELYARVRRALDAKLADNNTTRLLGQLQVRAACEYLIAAARAGQAPSTSKVYVR